MSLRVDRVQLEIIINNDQARKQMRLLNDELRQAQKELKGMTEGTEEYVKKSVDISRIKNQMDGLKRQIGITGLTLKKLNAHLREQNLLLSQMRPNTAEYKKLQKEIAETSARIKELKTGAQETGMSWGKMADGFNRYFAMATAFTAVFTGTIYTIKQFITTSAELSDSLADIRKTTGLSASEVENLDKQLKKIDTRTSRADLRQMAVVAGQLGIAKDQVYGFVESIDKLNVALSDEIQGGAEEVAKTMGTLRNVLTDMKSSQVDQDMLRIGNAVNALGAAGFATAPIISDFANRIGGIGIPLGLTSDEVLGLSATLQELNINTERGGTAVTKILQKMTTNTSEFARIAGMPLKNFTELVNTDLMGALLKVVEGSKRGGQSATLLAGIIKDLEVQGAGASEVFAKLSGNTDMLKEKIDLAGSSLMNTDSIMNEFNIKNATLGAVINKLSKEFYTLITLKGVQDFFKSIVYGAVQAVQWLKELPQTVEKYKTAIILVTGATLAWIAAKTREMQITLANNLMLKEGILLKTKDAIIKQAGIVQEQVLTAWRSKSTIATKLQAVAQLGLNAAMNANPIGVVIMGLTALVAGIKAYDKYNGETVRLEKEKQLAIQRLDASYKLLDSTYNSLTAQIRSFNKLSIQEKKDLLEKIDMTLRQAEAELILQETKRKDIGVDNTRTTSWQKMWNYFTSGGQLAVSVSNNFKDALQNGEDAASKMDEGIQNLRKSIENLKSQQIDVGNILNAEKIGDAIGTATIDELEAKLSNYQTALRNASKDSEDYLRIQLKIKEVNKNLGSLQNTDPTDDEKKKSEKAKKTEENYRQLLKSLNALDEQHLGDKLNQFQREIIATQKKYDTLIEKAKKYIADNPELKSEQKVKITQKIENLEAEKDAAVKSVMLRQEDQYIKNILSIRNKMRVAVLSDYDKEIEQIRVTYDEKISLLEEEQKANEDYYTTEIINAEGNAVKLEQILAAREASYKSFVDNTSAYEEYKAIEIANKRRQLEESINQMISAGRDELTMTQTERDIKAIDDKYLKMVQDAEIAGMDISDIMMAWEEQTNRYKVEKAKETQKEINKIIIDGAQIASDAFFTIFTRNQQATSDAKLSELEAQKQKELSNKKLTEEQKAQIENKYTKLENAEKTKAWKHQKTASEIQAVINGALAVTNILATAPVASWPFLIPIAAATTAAQIAVIATEKPPQFQVGGYTGKGKNDQPAGIVHANEYVIPSMMMEDPLVKKYVQVIEAKRTGTNVNDGMQQSGNYIVSKEMIQDTGVNNAVNVIDQVKFNRTIIDTEKLSQTFEKITETVKNVVIMETKRDSFILKEITQTIKNDSKLREERYSNMTKTNIINHTNFSAPAIEAPVIKPIFSMPGKTIPVSFNVPEIEKAIRMAPLMSMMEITGKQTQEIVHRIIAEQVKQSKSVPVDQDKEMQNAINALTSKFSALDKLNAHLDKGIKATAPIVWSDLEDAQKSMDELKADTAVSFK